MKILRSYILKECILPFGLALGILTSVFLLGNLMQLAHLVINKGVSLLTVGKVFILYIPVLLGYTLPIACIVAVILAFGRLSADNEILAIRSNGVHLRKLFMPLAFIGIILSLLTFIINDRMVPYAYHAQRKLLKTLGGSNPTAFLEPGVFINSFENQILFIHKIEDNKMYNITIYQPQPEGRPTRTILAKYGEFSAVPSKEQIILKLMDGTSDEPDFSNPNNFYKLNFNTLFVTLNLNKKNKTIDKKPKSMKTEELLNQIKELERLLVNTARLKTELFRKITWSLSPLIFIFLGFPIAVITNRREKSANVVVAMIAVTSYYVLSMGCEALSLEQLLPAAIIMWGPNAAGIIAAIILNYRICRT